MQIIMNVSKRKETGEEDRVPWWGEEKEEKVRRRLGQDGGEGERSEGGGI